MYGFIQFLDTFATALTLFWASIVLFCPQNYRAAMFALFSNMNNWRPRITCPLCLCAAFFYHLTQCLYWKNREFCCYFACTACFKKNRRTVDNLLFSSGSGYFRESVKIAVLGQSGYFWLTAAAVLQKKPLVPDGCLDAYFCIKCFLAPPLGNSSSNMHTVQSLDWNVEKSILHDSEINWLEISIDACTNEDICLYCLSDFLQTGKHVIY